jgi:HPt (histidine-containing phosphotransfer) domain-containing protein
MALDREFLDELLDGDREFAEELFEAFQQAADQWLQEARVACSSGDAQQASRAFHTLKGSAGSVGLTALRELARDLEHLARDGELASCAGRQLELEERLQEGKSLLAGYLESL